MVPESIFIGAWTITTYLPGPTTGESGHRTINFIQALPKILYSINGPLMITAQENYVQSSNVPPKNKRPISNITNLNGSLTTLQQYLLPVRQLPLASLAQNRTVPARSLG